MRTPKFLPLSRRELCLDRRIEVEPGGEWHTDVSVFVLIGLGIANWQERVMFVFLFGWREPVR